MAQPKLRRWMPWASQPTQARQRRHNGLPCSRCHTALDVAMKQPPPIKSNYLGRRRRRGAAAVGASAADPPKHRGADLQRRAQRHAAARGTREPPQSCCRGKGATAGPSGLALPRKVPHTHHQPMFVAQACPREPDRSTTSSHRPFLAAASSQLSLQP